jgi:hypothetical protein
MNGFSLKSLRARVAVLALASAASAPVLAAGQITGAGSTWV